VAYFPFSEEMRYHAGHLTALFQAGVGHNTHEAYFAGAVHQTDIPLGKEPAQLTSGLRIDGIIASAGAAKDTYGVEFHINRAF
jgi:hypothetical protein